MKLGRLILMFGFISISPLPVMAQDESATDDLYATEEAADTQQVYERVEMPKKQLAPAANPSVDQLVSNDFVNLNRKIQVLEARLASIERENQFQDEKIRNIDRNVTDLKRRG